MKRLLIICLAFSATLPALAQSTDWTIREVRDPVQLRQKLNSDGTAADARLTALEGSTNVNGAGVFASITAGTVAVQTNATVGGTLGVSGAATFSGNAIANEVDARTATALLIGKATATSVAIGASDAGVTVPGTLAVTGKATFTVKPGFSAAAVAAPTNAAVLGWQVEVNGTNYVVELKPAND